MGVGVYVNPIEPIVEYAYHGHPQQKRKGPSCSAHWECYYIWLVFWILLVFCMSLFWTNTHDGYLYLLYFRFTNFFINISSIVFYLFWNYFRQNNIVTILEMWWFNCHSIYLFWLIMDLNVKILIITSYKV